LISGFVTLLGSADQDVNELAVWAVSNIAGDSAAHQSACRSRLLRCFVPGCHAAKFRGDGVASDAEKQRSAVVEVIPMIVVDTVPFPDADMAANA
jgi:hypothetical protein